MFRHPFVIFFILWSFGSTWLHASERVIDDSFHILYVTQAGETSRGTKEELFKPPVAVEITTLKTLAEVMAYVADKKIVYAVKFTTSFHTM